MKILAMPPYPISRERVSVPVNYSSGQRLELLPNPRPMITPKNNEQNILEDQPPYCCEKGMLIDIYA